MQKKQTTIAFQIMLSFVFVITFYLLAYVIIMVLKWIEDDIFYFNHFFIGFYQWLYTLPIILYLRKNNKIFSGFLIGGITLTLLNVCFIVAIFIFPSFFF